MEIDSFSCFICLNFPMVLLLIKIVKGDNTFQERLESMLGVYWNEG